MIEKKNYGKSIRTRLLNIAKKDYFIGVIII